MAAFFDHQYTWIKVIFIVTLLCFHVKHFSCKKHKHPPVVAFFQGSCGRDVCDQGCRDIDNGGYICECYGGFRLNHDGISCSKISKDMQLLQETHIERPDIVKIIPIDNDNDVHTDILLQPSNVKPSTGLNEVTFEKSVISKVSSQKNSQKLNKILDDVQEDLRQSANEVTFGKGDIKEVKSVGIETIETVTTADIGDENSSPNSIKIVTYDQTPEAPTLETDNLRSSETSGNNENLQNLVPNLLPVVPQSSDDSSSRGKCDEFSCLNNGKCVDDGTVFRNKVRCDCELGTLGSKCEKEVNIRYPRFYGNSYMALPVLKNGYKEMNILLEFKPVAQFGLLLFSSEFEDARSDFFSIALIDGYLEFRYDCGTGMGVVRSSGPVVMDTWNTLRIHRHETMATMWLNDEQPVQGTSLGSYSRLTLRLNLYVGGYDNIDQIQDKIGTSKAFVGCVEHVVVNDYKFDLRKAELVGDAQFGANVGECSEGLCDNVVCQNGGKCQVTSADSHVCLCPLGTGGESCQHVMDVHIPEFQGHSYLEFEGLGRSALLFLEIEIVLKATKADGLILYNGYTLDRMGDFISLALQDGHLEFRFDLGTGPAIIRLENRISLNRWHWVKVSRTGMEGILEIDDQVAAIGQSQGAFTQLTVTQSMYVGGHRNFDETSKLANVSQSFDGCIQKLIINNRPVSLIQDALSGVNIESCEHPCEGKPCLNGGECLPRKDVYTCYCPLGYAGNNCQKNTEKDMTKPRFSSESYLIYKQKVVAKKIGGDKIDIKFSIKPVSRNGLLLWSGPDIMQATSDYIALGFKDGALQFRYNLGSGEVVISYNNSRLFDGKWHNIHAQRDKQDGYISVDGKEIVEGSAKGSYTMLNTNKILYIGGMPDVSQGTLRKFSSGYNGCIQEMVLDNDFSLSLLQSADSGRNIVPCS
ncbi:pikachurin-like [Mercenaria mercenaria]|uniref:pikachurin-like n=1 Tax=Mercenaria mercenaria TaxID=6596 RepID=UPI00234E6734|nr:pikachurin-like [Mercenaria mercenaria]